MARPMSEMEIASGSGSYLASATGERFLDFTSGIGVTNTGHCHPRVVAAAQEQLGLLLHGQQSVGLSSPLVALTNRMLDGVVPASHDRLMFSTTGAEAVENAMRLARAATGRPNMIVFQGGYHGRSIGTLSLTRSKTGYGVANHPQMSGVYVAPFPYPPAGPHGGRPRQRQHHTATPVTAMGHRASPPPGQWPQPLRSHPPAL